MADTKGQPARLQDVLNYQADTYFSSDEIALIQSTFKNPKVLNVLRKALLPTVGDTTLPIEEMGSDTWLMGGIDFGSMMDSEVKPFVLGRQNAIKFVMGALVKLKVIANAQPESEVEAAFRRSKDSAK